MRAAVHLLAVAAIVLGAPAFDGLARADEPAFKIIVHPENPIDSVDRKFLRDAFLRKASDWKGGETVRPVDLAAKFPARAKFGHEVLRKTPAQLKTYWNQQIFSGKGVPPPETASPADAVAYVLAHRGAVAYLPADADPGEAKVVGIR
jgi:hypothetical protein